MNPNRSFKEINISIQNMLTNGEGVKKFLRFVANNPHLTLRDSCQIVTFKENLSFCHTYQAWERMNFQVQEDRIGVPYLDENGNANFVFDLTEVSGNFDYQPLTIAHKKVIKGLSLLNGIESDRRKAYDDFEQIQKHVSKYYENEIVDNKEFVIEGVSYFLFCKTGKKEIKPIQLKEYSNSLKENALLFKNVYQQANTLLKEIDSVLEQEENKNEIEKIDFRNYDDIVFDDIFINQLKQDISKKIDETKIIEFEEQFEKRYQELTKKEKILLALSNDMGSWFDEFSEEEVRESYEEVIEKLCGISRETESFEIEQPQIKEENKKGIRERKKKEITLLDLLDDPKNQKELFIKSQLLRGSMIEGGKKRIYEEYFKNPTINEFAKFLKDEYGIGGTHSSDVDFWNDAKGIRMKDLKNNAEEEIHLTWKEVALRIADLIDDKVYYTPLTTEERIRQIVNRLIKEGTENSNNGNWIVYFEEFKEDEEFVIEHAEEIENRLWEREEISDVIVNDNSFDMMFWANYVKNYVLDDDDIVIGEENTDLNDLAIQSEEFGGLKERYRNNVNAILTMQRINARDFKVTNEDRVTLAKYVGWGGIPQVFDENNENWKYEYEELKKILSQNDYERAKGSVLNAHYTSKEIINGMYQALSRFGIKGNNRILEPAMGTGNFFGYMPQEIKENSKLYGVELDNITGKIAKLLYPNVKIQIQGFEETNFPNNYFDIVMTNVPFGAYSVYDPSYNQHHLYIHDYFIAKSLDKVRSGGIVAVITSKGTMDKANPSVRKYIADRAELLGAIRLPNNAFEQSAKTKVTTDILFFQKRKEPIHSNIGNTEWLEVKETKEGFQINNYFIQHPQMLLGTLVEERGLYGAIDITLKPDERNLNEAIKEVITYLPQDVYEYNVENKEVEERKETLEVDYSLKPFCYQIINQKLYMRIGDEMVEIAIPNKPQDAFNRIKDMIALREELKKVLDIQVDGCSDEQLQNAQKILNSKYDNFVKNYGFVNSQTNFKLFRDDGDSAILFACENIDNETKEITKSDVFHKRTIRPYIEINHTSDCCEALQMSLNERGKVDISYIEEITNKNYDQVLEELGEAVYRNPILVNQEDKYSGFETAENYLSGNVVKKLKIVKEMNAHNDYYDYEKNRKALEEVQPIPLKAGEISVRLGASFIDIHYYKQFLVELLKMPIWVSSGVEVTYNHLDNSYKVEVENYVKWNVSEIYNTSRASVFRLYEDALNLKSTTIYDTFEEDGKTRRVLNKTETIIAREKQNKIKEEFKNWIFEDINRREDLEHTYNQLFNQIRLPTYDGSYLKFPKMNPAIELKSHQRNAVHRIITSGNTLLHHVVGSGKTYTICATIMKLRQYGLATKPMIVVPNHLVEQWSNEFRTLYPSAKLLVTRKEDLERHHRQKFVSKVAMGDYDAIIIAQSSFAKIPISLDRQVSKIKEEIKKVELTILNQDKKSRGSIKNLERIKKSKETKLKQLLEKGDKDNVLVFEKLGVDYLFVDEADCYKNLFLFTKMNNVSGISTTASQRASDLQLKCEYINELHGKDSGVVFATGTPISNSMTEMYTMQTYLQKRTLEELGIPFFDSWAADFGETITSLEMAPSGQGYKAKTRFAKFTNLPELLTLYRSFADVQTSEMVKLDVPTANRQIITLKPSETVLELAEEITNRAEAISEGNIDPHIDNMLKITSDGKKIALDPRCYDNLLQDEDNSKINACANNVFKIWQESKEKRGTQLIFCDLSTPKKDFDEYEYGKDFDVYNDLKYKLIEKGMPKEEIAFIHEAKNDVQKQKLFQQVNDGKIRILIGSTEKCGAGTNVQKHLIALHHLDTPYRPRDLQQRDGRIVRQGNLNKEVMIFTYVTERTFDSYSYQILENKQRFISQIDRGDLTIREADDIDETTLSYAEIKAITASNPKIKRKMEVDTEIAKLRILESQYKKNLYDLQDKIKHDLPQRLKHQDIYIEKLERDILHLKENYDKEQFLIQVLGKTYTDKKEGSNALLDAINLSKGNEIIGEYGGFQMSPNPIQMHFDREITLSNEGSYTLTIGTSASGNITRLDNFLADFPNRKERAMRKKEQLIAELEEAKVEVEKPFEYVEKLKALIQEQIEINIELDLNKKEEVIISEEDEEMEIHKKIQLQEEEEKKEAMILPDYRYSKTDLMEYGYLNNDMLPLSNSIAQRIYENGGAVYLLNSDNTKKKVSALNELEEHMGMCGMSRNDWDTFLNQEKVQNYLYARLVLCESGSKVVKDEMNYMDERFTYAFIEKNYDETIRLSEYFKNRKIPEPSKLKYYLSGLLDEFTDRLSGPHLMHYGWDKSDVIYSLSEKIGNEEIRNLTSPLLIEKNVLDHTLSVFYHNTIQKINGTPYDLDRNQIAEILPILEEEFKGSKWDSSEGKDYHKWFLDFASKTFPMYLYIKEDELDAVSKFLKEQQLSKKEIVQKRIIEEFKNYQENEILKTPEEIFNNSYQNYFYLEMKEFLINENNGLDEIHYEALFEDKEHVLTCLYDYYLKNEYASINNYEDIADFIFAYNEKYYNEILNSNRTEEEESMSETKKKEYLRITIPQEALIKNYEKHSFFRMPETSETFKGATYNLYNNQFKESSRPVDLQSERWEPCLEINLDKDSFVRIKKPNEVVEIDVDSFYKLVNGSVAEDYKVNKNWTSLLIPNKAVVAEYPDSSLIRMPKGDYENYLYYVPNKLIKEEDENTIKLLLPNDFKVTLRNYQEGKSIEVTAEEISTLLENKEIEDYDFLKNQPSLSQQFKQIESNLRNNVPEEMKNKPNWCVLRTRKNVEKGRLEKFIIDCHTGKFAKSDDSSTWSDFETACEYAKKSGGVALVYALDGKDEIACIDLDHCIDENGNFSNLAKEVIESSNGTYCEQSISGTGLHLFGKTKGMDLRSFSKDGDLEFYQKAHFIAMTGNILDDNKLESFDTPLMKELFERKCDKRPSTQGVGKGIEGLSTMSDRDVVEKAIASKHGDTFKALYEGQDIQNNHSNSDMSLMNRLAFWCNGDKEQMLRIFATSGLYRENKSPEYYEYTATKAIQDTNERFSLSKSQEGLSPQIKNTQFGKA